MKRLLDSCLDLIFPPRCEVCRNNSHETLCQDCFGQIKFMKPHLGIHGVSIYEGPIRTAIHRFKFNKRIALAEPLGIIMVRYLCNTPMLEMDEIDIIVPVPLHKYRHRQRVFNQAELLAKVVGKYFETPVASALERHKNTKAQFELEREQRYINITGAFRVVDSQAIFNKRVLLLDDIYTTGATIAECSKTLKIAGAKRVEILTLSRAIEAS